ncbi:MAG: rubrerythrin family protein [Clostridia bacterium]|nr:rubrerythrin family protein [Clostridia bacterium]
MDFEQSQTKTNLARAFAGECQGGARYQFIAQKAMQEGKKNIQMLFKTLAKNEMAHAKVFWDLIAKHSKEQQKNIEIKAGYPFEDGELKDMIKTASNNEKSENTTIYPSFAKIAEDEGFKDIAEKFKLIALVENDHFMILDELYNKIKDGSLYQSATQYEWKCGHCGHTQLSKKSFEICSLCDMDNGHVELTFLGNKKCCE